MSLDIWLSVPIDSGSTETVTHEVFSANITHNVAKMWNTAGIWEALYESAGKSAADVLPSLRQGLAHMRDNPAIYKALNAPNGWGTYDNALPWLAKLVDAFEEHYKGIIGVSR